MFELTLDQKSMTATEIAALTDLDVLNALITFCYDKAWAIYESEIVSAANKTAIHAEWMKRYNAAKTAIAAR